MVDPVPVPPLLLLVMPAPEFMLAPETVAVPPMPEAPPMPVAPAPVVLPGVVLEAAGPVCACANPKLPANAATARAVAIKSAEKTQQFWPTTMAFTDENSVIFAKRSLHRRKKIFSAIFLIANNRIAASGKCLFDIKILCPIAS